MFFFPFGFFGRASPATKSGFGLDSFLSRYQLCNFSFFLCPVTKTFLLIEWTLCCSFCWCKSNFSPWAHFSNLSLELLIRLIKSFNFHNFRNHPFGSKFNKLELHVRRSWQGPDMEKTSCLRGLSAYAQVEDEDHVQTFSNEVPQRKYCKLIS